MFRFVAPESVELGSVSLPNSQQSNRVWRRPSRVRWQSHASYLWEHEILRAKLNGASSGRSGLQWSIHHWPIPKSFRAFEQMLRSVGDLLCAPAFLGKDPAIKFDVSIFQ